MGVEHGVTRTDLRVVAELELSVPGGLEPSYRIILLGEPMAFKLLV